MVNLKVVIKFFKGIPIGSYNYFVEDGYLLKSYLFQAMVLMELSVFMRILDLIIHVILLKIKRWNRSLLFFKWKTLYRNSS